MELALQVRSHFRFGQSIFNLAAAAPLYRFDTAHQLRLLTANTDHKGSIARITTNSMGLRSEEIPVAKAQGEYRVAVVGASSVMGAYSKTNDHTLPALLQARLRAAMSDRKVRVINAGIAGASLADQRQMLHYIAPLAPDLVILYPGFNDLAGYCRRAGKSADTSRWPLPSISMPSFLLSTDLLLKNTVALRSKPEGAKPELDPDQIDTAPFEHKVEDLVDAAQALGFNTVIATVARAYRTAQPLQEQRRMAATALYYLPCFTLETLYPVHRQHNAILRHVAASKDMAVVDLARAVPGGSHYFADANHFTEAGEHAAADVLFESIWPELAEFEAEDSQ